LWLGTVPLTSGVVARIFGVRYLATLSGVVSLSHQVGAFLGAWLGGLFYDATGTYDAVWLMAIALGLFAAVIHLPIADAPLARLKAMPAG
jgi:predicted MFS family arabinose efflux permease